MKHRENLSTNANHIYVDTNVIVGAYYYELTNNECLDFKNPDLEDVIQYVISQKFKCRHIVTNNVKDYKDEEFLAINIVDIDNYRSLNQ